MGTKATSKTLISPNILRAAFTRSDPKSIKIQSICQSFFILFGYVCIKDTRSYLRKDRWWMMWIEVRRFSYIPREAEPNGTRKAAVTKSGPETQKQNLLRAGTS